MPTIRIRLRHVATATTAVVLVLIASTVGLTGHSNAATAERAAPAGNGLVVKCPFKVDVDFGSVSLPERMTRAQVTACQAFFSQSTPDGQFSPGDRSFSSQFCFEQKRRDACQQIREAACRLAVADNQFASSRQCLAAAPGVRVIVHRKAPRLSVFVTEPAVYEGPWLDVTDNSMDRWFPDGGRIYFYAPRRKAWDSRLGRIVPFPQDLVDFVARNPYVRVVGTRTVQLRNVAARQLDFVARDDPKARKEGLCGEYGIRDDPCLPITADPNVEGYVSFTLELGEPQRLIDIRTQSGRLILVLGDVDLFSEFAAAERLLKTLRVG